MTYNERTIRKIQAWITTELNAPGWNSSTIAKGLTDNVMDTISRHYNELNSISKQGILLALLYISRTDFLAVKETWEKILNLACKDTDEFVRVTGHIVRDYHKKNSFNLNIEYCSNEYRPLLDTIGESIIENGFLFHSLEHALMQPSARVPPTYADLSFEEYKPTSLQHFDLNTNSEYIISSDKRAKYLNSIIQNEEREENAKVRSIPHRPIRSNSENCSSLYITKKSHAKPSRTMNNSASHLKGFQREKKTFMLNQASAATFEKRNNIEIEKAKQDMKVHKKQKTTRQPQV